LFYSSIIVKNCLLAAMPDPTENEDLTNA